MSSVIFSIFAAISLHQIGFCWSRSQEYDARARLFRANFSQPQTRTNSRLVFNEQRHSRHHAQRSGWRISFVVLFGKLWSFPSFLSNSVRNYSYFLSACGTKLPFVDHSQQNFALTSLFKKWSQHQYKTYARDLKTNRFGHASFLANLANLVFESSFLQSSGHSWSNLHSSGVLSSPRCVLATGHISWYNRLDSFALFRLFVWISVDVCGVIFVSLTAPSIFVFRTRFNRPCQCLLVLMGHIVCGSSQCFTSSVSECSD